jgi:hypothetical protein
MEQLWWWKNNEQTTYIKSYNLSHKIFEKHCKSIVVPPKKDKGFYDYYLKVGGTPYLNVPKVHPNLKYLVKGKVPLAFK